MKHGEISRTNRLVAIDRNNGYTYIGLSQSAQQLNELHDYIIVPTAKIIEHSLSYRKAAINLWEKDKVRWNPNPLELIGDRSVHELMGHD